MRQVGGFLRVFRVSYTNKTDSHDITEILLNVVFYTITLNSENVVYWMTIFNWFPSPNIRARLCKLQKGCIWLAAASDKVYQLIAHGQ